MLGRREVMREGLKERAEGVKPRRGDEGGGR